MSRLRQLFKNLRYISKFDLRKNGLVEQDYTDLLETIIYYIPNAQVVRPNVLNRAQTVDMLCKTHKSLVRFGDGEISIIYGGSIPFQKYDVKLAKRLMEILSNKNNKILVGINYSYFYPTLFQSEFDNKFALFSVPCLRKRLLSVIDINKKYVNSELSNGFYVQNQETDEFFTSIRTLWNNKKVILVGCKEAKSKIRHNIFDNVSDAHWVYVPNINAYDVYEQTLEQITQYSTSFLVLIMAGPMGKVLVDDLSKLGYRALDMGHIAKAYDAFCGKHNYSNQELKKFWEPDR